MAATRPLRFGIQAGVTDAPYAERRDYDTIRKRTGGNVIVRVLAVQVEIDGFHFKNDGAQ